MPDSTIEPRTLTADEQTRLVHWLYQQRLAQNELQATGLTKAQLHHLGRIMHARLQLHAILNLPEALSISIAAQAAEWGQPTPPPDPIRVGVGDLLPGGAILDDEDVRAVAAVQNVLADYEQQIIDTGLTARQLIIIDRMRHYRQHLNFITNDKTTPPAEGLPLARTAAEPILTQQELEDFAHWAYTQGFRRGVKAMRPDIADAQINTPYLPQVFYFNMLADWRADRQEEESAQ